jgi:molybdopterin molybdotransferase
VTTVTEVPLPADLLTLERAVDMVLGEISGPLEPEEVAIADVEHELGRALAAPVSAGTDLPPWDNSAMDGYAVRAADVASAGDAAPVRLAVVGEVPAGSAPAPLTEPSTALRIATGAPLPPGADAVVPVELTTPLDAGGAPIGARGGSAQGPTPAACLVHRSVAVGSSVRRRGDDVRAGTIVARPGAPLTPAVVALAAGVGAAAVSLHRRPRVGVLATGDEVRAPGTDLGPAGIPDANGPALRALVSATGAIPVDLGIARDDLDDVAKRLSAAIDGPGGIDAVVVSGGVSVGPYDVVRSAFGRLGTVGLWRVAIQPGKPFAFGTASSGPLLFGLPGNPVSTFVTFELFVRPALRRLAGLDPHERRRDRAILLDATSTSRGRRTFVRVVAEREPDGAPRRDDRGRVMVRLAGGQGSHVLSALSASDALAVVPEDVAEVAPSSELELWWLDR